MGRERPTVQHIPHGRDVRVSHDAPPLGAGFVHRIGAEHYNTSSNLVVALYGMNSGVAPV
jgi:hypothetical protein